jgi:hypothetical protein
MIIVGPKNENSYVAQGSYIGAPVVYITHLTRENIKLSKKIHSLSFTE